MPFRLSSPGDGWGGDDGEQKVRSGQMTLNIPFIAGEALAEHSAGFTA
jgi:hypothetical protein